MPHEGEQTSYVALSRIAKSEKIRQFLQRCVKRHLDKEESKDFETFGLLKAPPPSQLPRFILAIDGSYAPLTVENGFPGAELGFISAALVLLDLNRIQALSRERFPAPTEVERTTRTDAGEFALPGCNIQFEDALDPKQSFRRQLYEAFSELRTAEDGESLLDTYHALLQYKGHDREERCPYEDCQKPNQRLDHGESAYTCSCPLERPLYSTDALRIHEAFNPVGPSGEAYGEVMQVTERLLLLNFLRTLEQKGWIDSLARIAFVIDGPLAVFGHPAWLKDAIQKELQRINRHIREATGMDLLLLGIEKSGVFMEHFIRLDTNPDGSPGRFPKGTVFLLVDSYIKEQIILSQSSRPYGYQTYFGRKFLYKTRSGARIVGMTPYLEESHMNLTTASQEQFPRLADALALLDALVSTRYPDAVVPIVEAHAQATIARGIGTRILEQLVNELLKDDD